MEFIEFLIIIATVLLGYIAFALSDIIEMIQTQFNYRFRPMSNRAFYLILVVLNIIALAIIYW